MASIMRIIVVALLLAAVPITSSGTAEARTSCRTQITYSGYTRSEAKARTIAAIHRYFPKKVWQWATRVSGRESNYGQAIHGYNPCTKDNSDGPMMVNFLGRMAKWLASLGIYPAWNIDGGIWNAARLWRACGSGPWTPPYSCHKGW